MIKPRLACLGFLLYAPKLLCKLGKQDLPAHGMPARDAMYTVQESTARYFCDLGEEPPSSQRSNKACRLTCFLAAIVALVIAH